LLLFHEKPTDDLIETDEQVLQATLGFGIEAAHEAKALGLTGGRDALAGDDYEAACLPSAVARMPHLPGDNYLGRSG
jgi:hypothetical protein